MRTDRVIHTALLSFGMSGRVFHAPFLTTQRGFALDAVWERKKQEAQKHYPGIKSYSTLNALLCDSTIELVIVNTPNYTHFEYARAALERGKHVVVEKPFVVTEKQGLELQQLANKRGLVLSVFQNRRYDSDFRTIRKVLASDLIGPVVEATLAFDRYRVELSPKIHKEQPGAGTGSLYDLGSHIIDQALQLFGWPESLFADITTMRPESQVDDYFDIILFYSDKRVRLHSSYLVREPLPSYVFHGIRGSFIKPRTDIQEMELQAGKKPGGADWGKEPESDQGLLHTFEQGEIIKTRIVSEQGNYGDYYKDLFKAIRGGQKIPVTASDGIAVIRLIEKAYLSSNSRNRVFLL